MPLIDPPKKAPAFTLKDQDGTAHKLSAYVGQPVVLFFYPKDSTSGCTKEACDFRDNLFEFKKSKAAVFGISILDSKSKAKFADKNDLDFPLLADDATDEDGKPAPKIAEKYGVWKEKSMYGKTYMGIERTTYLIDAKGKVAQRWDKVKVPGHVDAVLEAVKELA
ncbi:MAG: thioredoxin-dependent thiol peroxidase [Planctomycetota bacterium]